MGKFRWLVPIACAAMAAVFGVLAGAPIEAKSRSARSAWANRNLSAPQETYEEHFATSLVCANCHSNAPSAVNLRDDKGRGVAPFDLWQGTMMANSARDPLWRAVVSAEVADNPGHKQAIEAKCMTCHAPMAMKQAHLRREAPPPFSVLYGDGLTTDLALDGVSCTACHQLSPIGLGTPASFSGGFVINPRRTIYGPHPRPMGGPMGAFSGFTPAFARHISESKLCGSCHTLYTHTIGEDGQLTGHTLPEQSPYLEWRNSVYSTEAAQRAPEAADCQNCHMSRVSEDGTPIRTRIARTPDGGDYQTALRQQFSRHIFVGGNTLVPQMLRDNATELGTLAPPEAFDKVIELARTQLATRTAKLEITPPVRRNGALEFAATISNLTGHKFPTAYPARRAWLRVRLIDAQGKVVFCSGDYDDRGRILDADGRPLASENVNGPFEPHRDLITAPGEVQIYEAVMADAHGAPTWRLMRGATYIKDNRILPRGWRPDGPDAADTTPAGLGDDGDFKDGTDTVHFAIAAPEGELSLEVELVYQTLSWRYANELFRHRTPETLTFREYLDRADPRPAPVAATKTIVR